MAPLLRDGTHPCMSALAIGTVGIIVGLQYNANTG